MRKLLINIKNHVVFNKKLLFFILTFFDLVIYGINNHDHQLYNLDPLFRSRIIDGILNFDDLL